MIATMKISYKNIKVNVIDEDYAQYIYDMLDHGKKQSEAYPWGLFIIPYEDGSYVAIDNTAEAFTEAFDSLEYALKWLDGDFEVCEVAQ
jgi:hypothetical protein